MHSTSREYYDSLTHFFNERLAAHAAAFLVQLERASAVLVSDAHGAKKWIVAVDDFVNRTGRSFSTLTVAELCELTEIAQLEVKMHQTDPDEKADASRTTV